MRGRMGWIAVLAAVAALPHVGVARGSEIPAPTGGPDDPLPFQVDVRSEPIYGIAAQTHTTTLRTPDGVDLFLETWLPAPRNGHVPPTKLPTILVITPYVKQGTLESATTMDAMVRRGYAYSQLHVRGTGESGGCIQIYSSKEALDGARAIEWVATRSPWGNGVVGGYGVSYPGGTILNAAGRGPASQTKYLKAVVAGAPALSLYESAWSFDGVQSFVIPQSYLGQYMTLTSLPPGENTDPLHLAEQYAQKPYCYGDHIAAGLNPTGNVNAYYRDHDGHTGVKNIKAAVFTFHGHGDLLPLHGVAPILQSGLFDELPATTPRFGIFGEFGHENPSNDRFGIRPDIRRSDFLSMEIAWFDHFLKGIDSGIDTWGVAQVQGNDGRWRLVDSWPSATGGPVRTLALGADGRLGATGGQVRGATTYREAGFVETTEGFVPGTSAVFDTGPLAAPLELTGMPTLDVWLQLVAPDSHVAARLEAFDAAGKPISIGSTYAMRSMQHLDPIVDGRFAQGTARPAPVLTPFKATLRFQPTDMLIPAGGRLRLTIAGSIIVNPGLSQLNVPEPLFLGPTQPSGVVQPVKVLHDPAHRSVLRFETRAPDATYLDPE